MGRAAQRPLPAGATTEHVVAPPHPRPVGRERPRVRPLWTADFAEAVALRPCRSTARHLPPAHDGGAQRDGAAVRPLLGRCGHDPARDHAENPIKIAASAYL